MSKLGTFVALGVRGSGMIEDRSFNLGEFYVKMEKKNRNKNCIKEGNDIWLKKKQLRKS